MYINNQFQTFIYQPNFQNRKVSLGKLQTDLASNLKMEDIARKNNISVRTLYNLINQFNLTHKKDFIDKKIQEALPLLQEGQLTQKEISAQTGLSKYMLTQIVAKYFPISPHKEKMEAIKESLYTPLSNKEIAQKFNININSVKKLRHRLNAGNQKIKKIECLKQILKLKETGETDTAIANKLNINRSTVFRLLKAYKNNEISI